MIDPTRSWRQRLARRVQARLDQRAERHAWPQWLLLVGHCDADARTAPDPTRLTPILPPEDRFWADPFLWRHAGQRYVFCEEYPRATGRGRISVLTLGADLQPLGEALPVLDEPRHFSYPFIFDYGNELYMIPETARSRRVDLYQCEHFPERWVRRHSLLSDIEAADATLFEHAGRWWLFCAARMGQVHINESLFAFWADSPVSEHWTPHPGNPLVRDFTRGRPAGRIFRDDQGRLIRPGQDCVPRYGHGLGLYLIDTLTPQTYREHRIWHVSAPAVGRWRALHHLDWHAGDLIMDAQRLIPRASPPGASRVLGES
ncbi:MAG: hypothetical protein EOM91_00215 [Sphingobacteriia bacterium]|nr:hypothetical protein [Sphingobacteriia bacterium]NCC40726.1 hypothetical protein [Gammaproteobacteria bacterium]